MVGGSPPQPQVVAATTQLMRERERETKIERLRESQSKLGGGRNEEEEEEGGGKGLGMGERKWEEGVVRVWSLNFNNVNELKSSRKSILAVDFTVDFSIRLQ
ncbi:hypothetical protein Taro_056085 [Colocasia esculenta]|uniref:Uncharacterized protein n=1 Tax=Colocasia esculenta TaxID=4460 RepID=A0A843XT00_COLES|nr:hypothetical protein [Colocasia esculenta]